MNREIKGSQGRRGPLDRASEAMLLSPFFPFVTHDAGMNFKKDLLSIG